MTKSTVFEKELSMIQDEKVKEFTKEMIELLPEYFFEVPASSTGKYHPQYALGRGGLVRHTKAAIGIARELFRLEEYKFDPYLQDLIVAALILHDGFKHGAPKQRYTLIEHPKLIAAYIRGRSKFIDRESVCHLIETHMGQWVHDYKTGAKVLEKPETKAQKFIHLCDYIASRKCLEYVF